MPNLKADDEKFSILFSPNMIADILVLYVPIVKTGDNKISLILGIGRQPLL